MDLSQRRNESRSWLQYPASRLQRLLRSACPLPAPVAADLRLRNLHTGSLICYEEVLMPKSVT